MASYSTTFSFSIFLFLLGIVAANLSSNFYEKSCPQALSIIQGAVSTELSVNRSMGAALLRLHFHDCFVNGCDASILLDDTADFTGEKTAIPNVNSVRGYEVIDNIKTDLEKQCAGIVSCADILAVAARDAVVALDGREWTVLLGRKDSITASLDAANRELPSPFSDLTTLISEFKKKGFTAKEMVALSGAHTIGKAKCAFFRNRIYSKTSNIEPNFAQSVKEKCPNVGGDSNNSDLDETTHVFDNTYFRNLVEKKGLLPSDQELFNGGSTDSLVDTYRLNSDTFFNDFGNAMIKMGNLSSPAAKASLVIRNNCRKPWGI